MKLPVFVAPLLLLMVWAPQALSGKMTFAWEATTTHTDPAHSPATDLAGYHLYYWQGSGTQKFVNLGKEITSYTFPDTFTDLVEGQTYSSAVTAYATADKAGVFLLSALLDARRWHNMNLLRDLTGIQARPEHTLVPILTYNARVHRSPKHP
jgi:hypothetical protein